MKITFRIWLLMIFVALSLISIFAIPPIFMQNGVVVNSVEQNSTIFEQGLRKGMVISSINVKLIESTQDYHEAMSIFQDNETHKLEIKTENFEIINLFSPDVVNHITVGEIPNTRISTGLDIQGGARALVTSSEHKLTYSELDDLIAVSQQRLNLYGLSDVSIKKASDMTGNNFMVVEIAGSSPSDLEELITQQGKFEAKIGNETVFRGGKKDITYVGRSGRDAGITECYTTKEGELCKFMFVITLSPEAANYYANITNQIPINASNPDFLEKTIDFYLDDKLTESLLISKGLKGNPVPQHSLQGSGAGVTREEAIKNAEAEMQKLQAILITGSLPFRLEVVKTDLISPTLGDTFTRQIFFAGIFALISVSIVILVRYRNLKLSLLILCILISEIIIILGMAALINWNLDLPSIAGIIAAIGTGVDDQVVILDEAKVKGESLKKRIKNALFIVFSAYATTVAALIPLTGALTFMGIGAVSAGLLKGFAVTTLIGITSGVFITRPAFADIARQIQKD